MHMFLGFSGARRQENPFTFDDMFDTSLRPRYAAYSWLNGTFIGLYNGWALLIKAEYMSFSKLPP